MAEQAVAQAPAAVPAVKTAEQLQAEAVTAERLKAFEFGMEGFCKEAGITTDQLSQAAGVKPEELVPATVNWLTAQLDAEKQAQAQAK